MSSSLQEVHSHTNGNQTHATPAAASCSKPFWWGGTIVSGAAGLSCGAAAIAKFADKKLIADCLATNDSLVKLFCIAQEVTTVGKIGIAVALFAVAKFCYDQATAPKEPPKPDVEPTKTDGNGKEKAEHGETTSTRRRSTRGKAYH